jgi:DNA-directed RNA polymerase specialized sigma24 family protein
VPREVVALVSADDVVAAVRVHADRVHDLLRRSGCGAEEAVEVCESYAIALIDALVNAPETVGDTAGWWFRRALELGRRLGAPAAEPVTDVPVVEMPTSVLSGTSGEAQVRAALAALPEQERAAVLLRDGYDLPPEAVSVALARDQMTTATLVAAGRLRLVALYDDTRVPDLGGHVGRGPADLGMLGRLADGSLAPQRGVPLRRHLGACTTCEEVVEQLAKARRLVAGLPIIAMPDDAREAMLERVSARAHAVLPSVDEVLVAIDEENDVRPTISPIIAIFAIVVALVLGVGIAVIMSSRPGGGEPLASSLTPGPVDTPAFSVPATPKHASHSPRPGTASATPSATASATPSVQASATSAPPAIASMTISPTSGGRGTTIIVTGSGWDAGVPVTIRYTGALTTATQSATPRRSGTFTVRLTANGTLPGSYTVSADNGVQSDSQQFRQTS